MNVRELSAPVSPEAPAIPSVTIEEFDAMRAKFLAQLADSGETTQEVKALLVGDIPYQNWISILKSTTPRLDLRWREFRRDSILDLFELRLVALEVQRVRIDELKVQLIRDFEQTRASKLDAEPLSVIENESVSPSNLKEVKEKQARELLHAAIDRMTIEQMHGINIPFSIVLELVKYLPQQ